MFLSKNFAHLNTLQQTEFQFPTGSSVQLPFLRNTEATLWFSISNPAKGVNAFFNALGIWTASTFIFDLVRFQIKALGSFLSHNWAVDGLWWSYCAMICLLLKLPSCTFLTHKQACGYLCPLCPLLFWLLTQIHWYTCLCLIINKLLA